MQKWRHLLGVSLTALSLAVSAGAAHATEGYFLEGASARDQGLAGIDSANPGDSLTIGNNPAGLVDVGTQFNGDISLFMPWRGYTATPNAFVIAPGSVNSERNAFVLPTLGYSHQIDGEFGLGRRHGRQRRHEHDLCRWDLQCDEMPSAAILGGFGRVLRRPRRRRS